MNDWKETEEIVALIEKVISPSSRIETNVFLPDLNSTNGSTRQCDIVVKTGQSPRETISIIEVQNRTSKVDINTFDGWCQKMRDVGAQHLICVTKKGFPSSVEEKALRIGPTVRLLTLKQLASGVWPLSFLSNIVNNPRRELIAIESAEVHYTHERETDPEDLSLELDEKCIRYNSHDLTPKELIMKFLDYLQESGEKFTEGNNSVDMKLPLKGDEMTILLAGIHKKVISFSATFVVNIKNRVFELSCSEYKQIKHEGDLAWLMETNVYKNDKLAKLKIILASDNNGSYRIATNIFT